MRVVILGCGKLGSRLGIKLSEAGHRITILDRNREALKQLGPNFKGETLAGSAFIEENIQRIFTEKADVFIAVTDKDNVNIMFAQWIKNKFKVPRVIARIYDPILAGSYRDLGVETICPTNLALEAMLSLLKS
jgi:trk system potassium uptake protein TrkA